MPLSLEKKTELVTLSLAKRSVPPSIKMAVKLFLDVSGSMQDEYRDGLVQELTDRLLPIGMRFDDNQSIDCVAFGSSAKEVAPIKVSDFGNYINRKFLPALQDSSVLWSGTSYSRALTNLKPSGFMSGLFKKSYASPTYAMFVTDGDTQGDEAATQKILESLADKNVYVQLIGLGTGSTFSWLKRWADMFDHVGFVTFPNLAIGDEAMYNQLLTDELCTWVKER